MSYAQDSSSTFNLYTSGFQDSYNQSNDLRYAAGLLPSQASDYFYGFGQSLNNNAFSFLDHPVHSPQTLPVSQSLPVQQLLLKSPAVSATPSYLFPPGLADLATSSTQTLPDASSQPPNLSQPLLQHNKEQHPSQDIHNYASTQNENETQDVARPHLEASLYVAMMNIEEDERCQVQQLPARFNNFPILLNDLTDFTRMKIFQERYFGNTYHSLGLSVEDIHGYGIRFYDTASASSSQVLATTEHAWRNCLYDINNSYHSYGSCPQVKSCPSCQEQPRVYTIFNAARLRDVFSSNNIRLSAELQYRDAYDPNHDRRLSTHNWSRFIRYNNICQDADVTNGVIQPESQHLDLPATRQLYAPQAVAPGSDYNQVLTYTEPPGKDPFAAIFQPPQGAIRPVPLLKNLPQNIDSVRGPKGRRLVNTDTYNQALPGRDYTKATEQPQGATKREEDTCLTCIHHGRGCTGTQMILVKGKYRCPCCARKRPDGTGMRKCYWRNDAAGIFTYEDAKAADPNKFINKENTREGKLARAANRLKKEAENQVASAGDAEMTDK